MCQDGVQQIRTTSPRIVWFIRPVKTKKASRIDLWFGFGAWEPSSFFIKQVTQKKVGNVKRWSALSCFEKQEFEGLIWPKPLKQVNRNHKWTWFKEFWCSIKQRPQHESTGAKLSTWQCLPLEHQQRQEWHLFRENELLAAGFLEVNIHWLAHLLAQTDC